MFHDGSVCGFEAKARCCALVRTQMLQEEYIEAMMRDSDLNATAVGRMGQKTASVREQS